MESIHHFPFFDYFFSLHDEIVKGQISVFRHRVVIQNTSNAELASGFSCL